jgi:hypothetical protein
MAEGFRRGAENSGLFDRLGLTQGPLTLFTEPSKLTKKSLGDLSDGGTPGHIPNPVVKAVSADGTWGATPWESRSLPRDFFGLKALFTGLFSLTPAIILISSPIYRGVL